MIDESENVILKDCRLVPIFILEDMTQFNLGKVFIQYRFRVGGHGHLHGNKRLFPETVTLLYVHYMT